MKFCLNGLFLLALLEISIGIESSNPEKKIDDKITSCPTCDVEYCPKTPQECSHGLVRDECGCCKEGVCVLKEKEKCLDLKLFKNITETDMKKLSVCDEYLKCTLRTDLKAGVSKVCLIYGTMKEVEESVCECQAVDVSCGKDNVTYSSICQVKQAGTELKHPGPCMTAPQIISEPEVTSPVEHERFSLNCEAKGFPVPLIYWEFEGLNGLFKSLPGDDHLTAVHSRGGPELLTVTSWVMIESLRQSDAGTYICVAKNSEGVSRAVASVHVIKRNS